MSLQVWLPMTKDLRQQGLSDRSITNSGVTFDLNGKLGGCYVLDGTDDAIGIGNLSTLVETDFSFACWFYHDDTWSSKSWETIFGGPSGFELQTKNSSTNSPCIYLYSWGKGTFTYDLSTWNHLVMTRSSSETKVYLNGELKLTGTAGSIPSGDYFIGSWKNSTSQNFKGKVCDVRIYDHCLSPMEVKRISQGLILHYPLNNMGFGQENLLKDSHVTVNTSSYAMHDYYFVTGEEPVEGETYTIQIKGQLGEGKAYFGPYNSGGSVSQISLYPSSQKNGIYTGTFSWRKGAAANTFLRIYHMSSSTVVASTIEWVKLEKGSIATPWCPNHTDDLATQMGLNSNIEYDTSGYCNNGTRTGTFSWTSDTPKYSVSTYMPTAATISHSRCLDNTSQEWTCAAWVKPDATGNYQNLNNFNKSNRLYHGTYPLLYLNSGTNDYYNYGNLALPANQWSHIVFVFKNSTGTKLIYVNGENRTNTGGPNKTSTPKGIPDTVIIGGSFAGYMCDYREYATALSADDVKSLYQNTATIDADGTIHGAIR